MPSPVRDLILSGGVHTPVSCNVGDMSGIVPYERKTALKMLFHDD